MNRIFQARITLGQYLFLLLVTGMTFWALWTKNIGLALMMVIVLLLSIEKLIHTTYTITGDGSLVLYYGRFMKGKTIPLGDITKVESAYSMSIFGFKLMRCVLVHHNQKTEALMPVKEKEFVELINVKTQKLKS
ncbi:MAG: PH domain-containing protein [Bacteroidales bacterium]|jgi:hypothetical protein